MEIKIIFEIEEGSKQIIENLSKALLHLENTTTIQSAAGTVIGKVTNFVEKEEPEDVYVKQEAEIEKPAEKPKKTTKKAQTQKSEPEQPDWVAEPSESELPTAPAEQAKEEPKISDPVPTAKPKYTRADLARVGRELAINGKRDEVLKAFTKMKAATLADVQPEQFDELAEIYISLGGKF